MRLVCVKIHTASRLSLCPGSFRHYFREVVPILSCGPLGYGVAGIVIGAAGPVVIGPGRVFVGAGGAGVPSRVSELLASVSEVRVPFVL